MPTTTQIKNILVENLTDIRSIGAQVYLNKLIKRNIHGGGIPEFRLTNKNTDVSITDLAGLIAAIDETKLQVEPHLSDTRAGSAQLFMQAAVILDNIEVDINDRAVNDNYFSSSYGTGKKKPVFIIGYTGDDAVNVIIKIVSVRLIPFNHVYD